MIKFCAVALLFISSVSAAARLTSVDLSYSKGDFAGVYHDAGEKIVLNADLSETNKFFIGYEHVQRDYTSEIGFYRDALLIGDTVVFKEAKAYVDFVGSYAGDTVVGAQAAGSLVPHTTYFNNWDLSLGLHYATYDSGDVQTIQPQFLYFFNDLVSAGHSSWFYEDGGWHHAHREFVRARHDRFGGELSWAGGENREDVGLIDQFNAVSLTTTYYHKYGSVFLSLEDYQGQFRRGSQWGTGLQWLW